MVMQPSYRTALLAMCFSVLTGAANAVTFYSEARDAQAKAVKDAWEKVDLKQQIEVPRANLANLLSQQLSAQKSFSEVRRDALIQSLTMSTNETVSASMDRFVGLLDLIGVFGCTAFDGACWAQSIDRRNEWNASVTAANLQREILKATQARLKRLGFRGPECFAVLNSATAASAIEGLPGDAANSIPRDCAELAKQETRQAGFSPTMNWVSAELVAKKAAEDLENSQKAADVLKKGIADALKEAETESAKPNNLAEATKAAAKLKDRLTKLLQAQDVFHVELLSQTKQESLNAFLATLVDAKDGTAPPATSPKAAMAVVLFSQFFDEATSTLKKIDEVSLVPVVLEREVARFQQEAAAVDIRARRDRVALLNLRAKVLRKQVEYFLKAEDARGTLTESTLSESVSAALLGGGNDTSKVADDQRQQLWLALAFYLQGDALRWEVNSVDMKLAATDRAASLAYTEANVNAWQTLVNAHVNQLEVWAKAGIKVSEITAALQALAGWWIAYGVNK